MLSAMDREKPAGAQRKFLTQNLKSVQTLYRAPLTHARLKSSLCNGQGTGQAGDAAGQCAGHYAGHCVKPKQNTWGMTKASETGKRCPTLPECKEDHGLDGHKLEDGFVGG